MVQNHFIAQWRVATLHSQLKEQRKTMRRIFMQINKNMIVNLGVPKKISRKRYRKDHENDMRAIHIGNLTNVTLMGKQKMYLPGEWNRHMKEKHNVEAPMDLSDDSVSDSD